MHWLPILCFVALLFVPNGAWAQGEPLGPEFRVNTYTPDDQINPSVASDSSGNFVVVWSSYSYSYFGGGDLGVFGQRYASSGAPLGPEFRVNTSYPTTKRQLRPAVDSDSSGNFVVVWETYQGVVGSSGVFGQRYSSTGAPLGPEFRVNTYTPLDMPHPAVASDSSGNFVVVWENRYPQDGSLSGIFGQRYASTGAPLGPEFRVNTYTTHTQFAAAVASDSSGNFVVVWYSYSQAGSHVFQDVFGQRFASTGAPVGPEFRVNTYTTDGQLYPAVASDASGNFVVVWYSYSGDGSYKAVIGQRFASTGAPVGPEFRVNTYTTDRQGLPAVASDAAGNFVVVWNSLNQDGSSYGVFGQRYSQIVPVELMHFRVE